MQGSGLRRTIPISEMTDDQWRGTMQANLDSIFYTTREAAKGFRNDGRIVLVSSTAGQRGEAFHVDYAASKGAIISMVKGLCVELGPQGYHGELCGPRLDRHGDGASPLTGRAARRPSPEPSPSGGFRRRKTSRGPSSSSALTWPDTSPGKS